jgi:glycosyltransferase involved in cell wall biosynthesis
VNVWFAANIPKQSKGGIARSMRGLSEGLGQRGHCVRILLSTSDYGGDNYLVFAMKLGLRLLLRLRNPPDWIIARSSDGFFCALVAKTFALKTRVALHNHGWEENVYEVEQRLPRSLISFPTTWKARMFRFPLLRLTLSLSDCCLSGTLSELRWLGGRYPKHRRKMRYVPNGVRAGRESTWEGRSDAPMHFLSVGGETWKKNLGHVVAVFGELRKRAPVARLFLVGTGSNAIKGVVLTEDDRAAMTIVAEEDPQRMSQWYETCPYFISCARYEGGHSLAILEALSHGCVVFASAIPSTKEIITNNNNGVLLSGVDVMEDAAKIAGALANGAMIDRIRRHALRTAQRNRLDRQIIRLEKVLCRP